jgi:inosine-uridine nucleoside N-ribohydrolase
VARDDREVRVYLDTDLGGNPDDLAALAMLLGWPGAEVVGVTTSVDPGGVRAGYARHILALAGVTGVPVVAGSGATLDGVVVAPLTGRRFWPGGVAAEPAPPGAAVDLLAGSVEQGATVVVIGPQTNLALLEEARPDALAGASVVVMGGWVRPLGDDLPSWGPARDWNVACDVPAAERLAAAGAELTLVTLADTVRTHLRERDLPVLRTAGPVGDLLARQAVAYAADRGHAALARAHRGLPDDLLLFLHDPLACAVAVGWPDATTAALRLRPVASRGALTWEPDDAAPLVRVVTDVDGPAFTQRWLAAVRSLAR